MRSTYCAAVGAIRELAVFVRALDRNIARDLNVEVQLGLARRLVFEKSDPGDTVVVLAHAKVEGSPVASSFWLLIARPDASVRGTKTLRIDIVLSGSLLVVPHVVLR